MKPVITSKERKRSWRDRMKELVVQGVGLVLLGLFVVWSGIIPLKASSGHWLVTSWFLSWASRQSIATHSRTISNATVRGSEQVELGAVIFDLNCAWCHGSKIWPGPSVAGSMTPPPPALLERVSRWDDRELLYIVQHGIKFTGMPAWPAQQRPEEISPVIAFLREIDRLSAEEYGRMVQPSPEVAESPRSFFESLRCKICHGENGQSPFGHSVPELANQSTEYLIQSLQEYRNGRRESGVMEPIARKMTDLQIRMASNHYSRVRESRLDQVEKRIHSPELAWEVGVRLIREGDSVAKIPACISCHGQSHDTHPEYPRLIGQSQYYLESQLKLYSEQIRQGGHSQVMHEIAGRLSQQQQKAVAAAFQWLGSPSELP